ncbi:hypothetical protein [Actinacidiphila oryziradicis]|uniref:Uncharacterized protein n=1 Tax=Actinacidiphila oryziradicis TaxID=2571141 RepID=A0A4U0SIH4_9ACTN|nr:hypothetical protein [Actinacidiphila oryziradicis]TKA09524.1 hypothetical protein FCI23_22025 [Actinacidiphila oryziradicis]
MSGLIPTADLPGLWVSAPPDLRNWQTLATTPRAVFVCRCGLTRRATGTAAVAALVAEWNSHRGDCPAVPLRPCQHCGTPTTGRSHRTQSWPACPDCHAAWQLRPEEQRRREQAAKSVGRRERQRRQTRRTRRYLESTGVSAQVAAAIVSGALAEPDEPTP